MKPLTLKDVLPLEEYERERVTFRQRIINLKQWRRISVGDRITLVFENRDTVLFQIQEMVRAERILAPERIREEVESYNEQIPGTGELSATLLIEVTDPATVKEVLDGLKGIDRGATVALRVGTRFLYGAFEQGRSKEDKISAVHYVRFRVPEPVMAEMRNLQIPMEIVLFGPSALPWLQATGPTILSAGSGRIKR
jgi:uncharacterized protein DUF3501